MSEETWDNLAGGEAGAGDEGAEAKIAQLTAELDEAKAKALRLMADFNNYQRRALQNEQTARRAGVAAVVVGVVPVLDHFDIAFSHVPSGGCGAEGSAATFMEGVKVIREELLKVLATHGVTLLNPRPNDEFEPGKHEAVMQRPQEGIEPGRIVQTFQPGYLLGADWVVRPAKVVVAPGA